MPNGADPHPALSRKRERVPEGRLSGRKRAPDRVLSFWLAIGWIAFALLPWHALEDGIFAPGAFAGYPFAVPSAPALFGGQWFMLPLLIPLVAVLFRLAAPLDAARARLV